MIDLLQWIHEGAGLAFWDQVIVKSSMLVLLLATLFFVPDTAIARKYWPVRFARTYLAVAAAILLGDYYADGYAKHLMIANFFLAVNVTIWANRWAAHKIVKDYRVELRDVPAP